MGCAVSTEDVVAVRVFKAPDALLMPSPELHVDIPDAVFGACTAEWQRLIDQLDHDWEIESSGAVCAPPSAAAAALDQARIVALGRLQHGINGDPAQFPVPPESRRAVNASVATVRAWAGDVVYPTVSIGSARASQQHQPSRPMSSATSAARGSGGTCQLDSGMDTSLVSRPFTLSFASDAPVVLPLAGFAAASDPFNAPPSLPPTPPPSGPAPLTVAALTRHVKQLPPATI